MIPFLGAVLLTVAPSAAAAAPANAAGRDPAAIRELAAGRRKDANAAWWGFDPANATEALQSAIRSGAATVVVPNVGKPWIVDPIFLESDQEIDLEPGVQIEARRGGFRGKSDELFRLQGKSNVVIKGYGAVFRMRKDDYRKAPYGRSEWRDCLGIYGGKNIQVLGLTLADSGGDGIYIAGDGAARPFSESIRIKDVVAEDNYRQGMSVISVEGLEVENAIFRGTEGTAPQAGIDFEPNGPTDRLSGIRLSSCVVENNAGYGISVYTGNLAAGSAPVRIDIEGGRSAGNGSGALFVSSRKAAGGISVRSMALDGKRVVRTGRGFVVDIEPEAPREPRTAARAP